MEGDQSKDRQADQYQDRKTLQSPAPREWFLSSQEGAPLLGQLGVEREWEGGGCGGGGFFFFFFFFFFFLV